MDVLAQSLKLDERRPSIQRKKGRKWWHSRHENVSDACFIIPDRYHQILGTYDHIAGIYHLDYTTLFRVSFHSSIDIVSTFRLSKSVPRRSSFSITGRGRATGPAISITVV